MTEPHLDHNDEKPEWEPFSGFDFTEKPKRDFVGAGERKRGGCLTAYLVLAMIGGACSLPGYLFLLADGGSSIEAYNDVSFSSTWLILSFVLSTVALASAVGLWQWKRWGYTGLLATQVANIAFSLTGGFANIVCSLPLA